MRKDEFLGLLRKELSGLPDEDIQKSLEYYGEMISDRMEDGIDEEAAVEAVGKPSDAAESILSEISLPKLIKKKITPKRSLRAWEIVFLIIGSPLWLTILIVAAVIVLSVYIVIWSLVLVMYAVTLALAAGLLAGLASVVFPFFGDFGSEIIPDIAQLGIGAFCGGLAILMFFASNYSARMAAVLGKKILLGIKRCFIGKGAKS